MSFLFILIGAYFRKISKQDEDKIIFSINGQELRKGNLSFRDNQVKDFYFFKRLVLFKVIK